MEASANMDRTDRVVETHLRLLAEAASDALERQAATCETMTRMAQLKRLNMRLPWTKRRWS